MWLRRSDLLIAFVAAGTVVMADGDLPGVSAAPSCRNLATELTVQTTAPGGFVANMKTSCSFNAPAKQSTCTVQYLGRTRNVDDHDNDNHLQLRGRRG